MPCTSAVDKSSQHCFCFRRLGMRVLHARQVHVSPLCVCHLFVGCTVGTVFCLQQWCNSRMCYPSLQFQQGGTNCRTSSLCSWVRQLCESAFNFLFPRSSHKIRWRSVWLTFSSFDNIRTVIWRYCGWRSQTRSVFLGVLVVDGRLDLASCSIDSSPSRKRLYHSDTHTCDKAS